MLAIKTLDKAGWHNQILSVFSALVHHNNEIKGTVWKLPTKSDLLHSIPFSQERLFHYYMYYEEFKFHIIISYRRHLIMMQNSTNTNFPLSIWLLPLVLKFAICI